MESTQHVYRYLIHPREKANIFSILSFSWTLPTFWKGWKKKIEVGDLYPPLDGHRSELLGRKLLKDWNKEVDKCENTSKTPSLLKAFVKAFGMEFFYYGIVIFIAEFIFRLIQPFLLGKLIDYATVHSTSDIENAAAFGASLIAASFFAVLFTHTYHMGVAQLGMKLRVATCSVIYDKVMQMKRSTNNNNLSSGHIVNLISNDSIRFDYAVTFLHDLWIGPIQVCIITYFMFGIVGVAAFVGLVTMFVFTPFQIGLGKVISSLRLRTAKQSDQRIGLMDELVKGIQLVKMNAWEKLVSELVADARRKEIKIIKSMSYIRGVLVSFIMYHTRTATTLTITTFALLGGKLTAKNVFMITSFFNILNSTIAVAFPMGISFVSEFITSVKRVQEFLLTETTRNKSPRDTDKEFKSHDSGSDDLHLGECSFVKFEEVSARWNENKEDNTIDKISFNATKTNLTAIIGPVGAGKSSMIHTCLGELHLTSGKMYGKGKVSFASQEPWLFTGTVRQNILFGEEFDNERYQRVLKVCALEADLERFPFGDQTLVGERGMSLSGGQKARINLARAIYRSADIYLIDDPLSAVDSVIANHLYSECIKGFLKDKVVIIVIHQLHLLEDNDDVLVLEQGQMKFAGKFKDLYNSQLPLVDSLKHQKDENTECLSSNDKQFTVENSAIDIGENVQKTELDKQAMDKSMWKSYQSYMKAAGYIAVIFGLLLFLASQILASMGDYWLSFWVYLEENVYNSKIKVSGNLLFIPSRATCLYIFGGLTLGTIVVSLIRSFYYFYFCLEASKNLHNEMFETITRAKMWFFNSTPSGNIMTRFSKDIGVIDEQLPMAIIDYLQIGLMALGITLVVPSTNVWLLIPTFLIFIIFYIMRVLYLTTSSHLRKLEAETYGPVYSHVSNSLQGLPTIHASEKQSLLQKEFHSHQDLHSSSWFMYIAMARAFALWLDLVAVLYTAAVTVSFLLFKADGGSIGLAITQASGLAGILQWGVRQSAEADNHMISVDRIIDYTKLDQEPPLQSPRGIKMIDGWPRRGSIDFVNVKLRYHAEAPWILQNLSFEISPGDKVGIVGRTGSGKSSIVKALFNLAETEGVIKIDGVDISTIGLHTFRSKITVIPQEPFLFSGTLRKNLDPFNNYRDQELWDCLDEVEMKDYVANKINGLDMEVSEGGSNLSVGQKQLICLARAILNKNKIVVLDEATANVDLQTETIIQNTLRQKFRFATVISIAHRLNMILESDVVIVMDNGSIAEIAHPYLLLQNKNGIFYGLVKEMGGVSDDNMEMIAKNFKMAKSFEEKCI